MPRRYHTLLARDAAADPWHIEFGAWDRDDVDAERDEYRSKGHLAAHLKIITSDGRQASIDAIVAAANGAANRE